MYFDLIKFAQRQGLLHYPFDRPFSQVSEDILPNPVGQDKEGNPLYSCKDCGNAVSEDEIAFWNEDYKKRKYYQNINLTKKEVDEFVSALMKLIESYVEKYQNQYQGVDVEALKKYIDNGIKSLSHINEIRNLLSITGHSRWGNSVVGTLSYLESFVKSGNVDNLYQASMVSPTSLEHDLLKDIEEASKFSTALNVKTPVCDDCAKENYTKCDSCGEHIPDNEEKYETAGNDTICQSCLDSGDYSTCESCGALVHSDETHWVEAHEASYCDTCYNNLRIDYDDFRDEIEYAARENPYPFKHWFPKESNRLYMDLVNDFTPNENDIKVMDFLSSVGCQVSQAEYQKGYCDFKGRTFKIGKFLDRVKNERKNMLQSQNKIRDPEVLKKQLSEIDLSMGAMLKQFVDSPNRRSAKKSDLKIVISQDPHDIGQMSTGRDWTSCMQLGVGAYHHDVFCEVEEGGLIAYLITSDDEDIEQPLARISIKRFVNDEGQSLAMPERTVYGNATQSFIKQVRDWLESRQKDLPKGSYKRKGGSYSDTFNYEYTRSFNEICKLIKTACGNSNWYSLSKDAQTLLKFLKVS